MWRTLIWLLLLLPQWSVAGEMRLAYGVEDFLWEEHDARGNRLLDEAGFRQRLTLEGDNLLSSQWRADLAAHLFFGRVAYDGQDSVGNPVMTDTDYTGHALEVGLSFLPQGQWGEGQAASGLRLALGSDLWERTLRGAGGYSENYQVGYGRAAVLIAMPPMWRIELGAKLPLSVSERVDLSDYGFVENAKLRPKGRPSLYASLMYRLDDRLALRCAYDGYSFAKSEDEVIYNAVDGNYYAIHQPRSDMHTLLLGISVSI